MILQSVHNVLCSSTTLPLESFFLNLIKSPWVQFKAIFACLFPAIQWICSVQKLADDAYCFRVGVYPCFYDQTSAIPNVEFSHWYHYYHSYLVTGKMIQLFEPLVPKLGTFHWVFWRLRKVDKISVLYMTLLFLYPSCFYHNNLTGFVMPSMHGFHHSYMY